MEGSRVSVYNDQRLPGLSSLKLVSPHKLLEHFMVADLIQASGSWMEGLIRDSFAKEDGEVIINLCLSQNR